MQFEEITCAGCSRQPMYRVNIVSFTAGDEITWKMAWPAGWGNHSTAGWWCPDCEIRVVPIAQKDAPSVAERES